MPKSQLQRLQLFKDMLEEAIDRGVSSVQRVHEAIADLPLEALEKSGLLNDEQLALRERQRQLINLVYDAVRGVNRGVGEFISEQIDNLEEGVDVAEVFLAKAAAGPHEDADDFDDADADAEMPPIAARPAPRSKPAARKAAATKVPAKQAPAKKAVSKKAANKKPVVKQVAVKKAAAKKAAQKPSQKPTQKPVVKKAARKLAAKRKPRPSA